MTAAGNDDAAVWCDNDTTAYGAGDFGTPRAPNDQCPIAIPDGMCMDAGGVRPAVAQTLVDIGVDLSSVTTLSNLQEGLRECLRMMERKDRARQARASG